MRREINKLNIGGLTRRSSTLRRELAVVDDRLRDLTVAKRAVWLSKRRLLAAASNAAKKIGELSVRRIDWPRGGFDRHMLERYTDELATAHEAEDRARVEFPKLEVEESSLTRQISVLRRRREQIASDIRAVEGVRDLREDLKRTFGR